MLPGKLCIGILEEDNPLKSYFRLKPLLVEDAGRYSVFEGIQTYPEEGCIRIVPDKNESSHFKARMRRMGRYCVLDLREHAGENDKIRPNKNYHGDETERNAHIVYSDVVREPAADMIFEILPADTRPGEWPGAAPGTPRVVREGDLATLCYTPGTEDAPGMLAPDGELLKEEEIQRFEIDGFPGEKLSLAVRLPSCMDSVIGVPAPKAEPAAPAEPPAPRVREPEPAPEPEKPWISHDLPKAAPARGGLSPMQQALAAQSGLNPRRNRSLQEIIEEKWRHSRVDQLGHPVPANAMGKPVENPLESAVEALAHAWRIPEIRSRLVNNIAEMQELAGELELRRSEISNSALKHELEDLEAERLKTLSDIDRLRREKKALRETFKQEIRQEEAGALREAIEKTRVARAEQKKYEEAAAEARKAAEFAQDAFASLNDGRFENKLRDFALTSRAAELLAHPAAETLPELEPAAENPGRDEWLRRMTAALQAEGLDADPVQAANLLVCAALGESIILSGEASSDKYAAGLALARALGAVDGGSFVQLSGRKHAPLPGTEAAAVALVRDANDAPGRDVTRGLCGADRLVLSVVADAPAGFPVSAEALERGFMLRLEAPAATAEWKPAAGRAESFAPASLAGLRDAVLTQADELPAAMERRLRVLREALAMHNVRISRHSLNAMWRYCAAMLSLTDLTPAEVLDRAFAQKALPCILAEAPVACLAALRGMLGDMPRSLSLLDKPLPISI